MLSVRTPLFWVPDSNVRGERQILDWRMQHSPRFYLSFALAACAAGAKLTTLFAQSYLPAKNKVGGIEEVCRLETGKQTSITEKATPTTGRSQLALAFALGFICCFCPEGWVSQVYETGHANRAATRWKWPTGSQLLLTEGFENNFSGHFQSPLQAELTENTKRKSLWHKIGWLRPIQNLLATFWKSAIW